MTNTEVVPTEKMWDEDTLRDVRSFEDALALLGNSGVEVVSTTDLGDGFRLCDNKDHLVGVDFIILGMKFPEGDHGKFTVLHVVTKDAEKLIVVDGSTGINAQAQKYAAHGRSQGIRCERGLVRSDYTYTDPDSGKEKPATTYYLS